MSLDHVTHSSKNSTNPLISLEGVSVTYAFMDHHTETRVERKVFQDLNVKIYHGERVLLLGPSGCGKSTLLHIIAGLFPDHVSARVLGKIILGGQDVKTLTPQERAKMLGVIFQDPDAQGCNLYVDDELAFGLENLNVAPSLIHSTIQTILTEFNLLPVQHQLLMNLSGGQKQLISIASVLAMDPQILALDEITSQLDPNNAHLVYQFLHHLVQKRPDLTMVIIEHRWPRVFPLVTRVLVFDEKGFIQWDGTAQQANELLDQHNPLFEEFNPDLGIPPLSRQRPVIPCSRQSALVSCRRVSFTYHSEVQGQFITVPVLQEFNLDLFSGEVVAIAGPNGSGKTTLLKLLAGVLSPTSGDISINGQRVTNKSKRFPQNLLGFVPQNPEHLFVHETVFQELEESVAPFEPDSQKRTEKIKALLKLLRLTGHERHNPFDLSGGEKRRLSLGCVLASSPSILLFDEPTYGLDLSATRLLIDVIHELQNMGHTFVIVTHDEVFAQHVANRFITLSKIEPQNQPCPTLTPRSQGLFQSNFLFKRNPLVKLITSVFFLVLASFVFDYRLLSIWASLALMGVLFLTRLSLVKIVKSTLPFLLLGLSFLWANILFPAQISSNSPLLFEWGFLRVYEAAFVYGITVILRALCFGWFSFVFIFSTNPTELILSFMHNAHLSPRIAFALYGVYKFIPFFHDELNQIRIAQRLRGMMERKTFFVKRLLHLAIPFLTSCIRKATRLAMSMECRGLGEGKRTFWRTITISLSDFVFLYFAFFIGLGSLIAFVIFFPLT